MSFLISIYLVQMSAVTGYKMKRKEGTHDRKKQVLYEQFFRISFVIIQKLAYKIK
jgi:hypothetical protein